MSDPPPATDAGSFFARAVLFPFLLTRAALLLVAWYAMQFAPSWTYPSPAQATRGWSYLPLRSLDVWGRYDTAWYLDVAANGYRAAADVAHAQSSLAFFPLYPWLVRGVHALLPAAWRGEQALFLAAVAVSNLLALAALAQVFLLARESFRDEEVAARTVLYLLLFPGSFFLSCAYSESLFLLLSATALRLAAQRRFAAAAACGLLLGLSRPAGVLLSVPLAWMALEDGGLSRRRVAAGALAAAAPPLGLLAHAAHLAVLTGDPLAVLHAQAAWGRALSWPWQTLLHPANPSPFVVPLEIASVVLVAALGLVLLRLRKMPFALLALVSLVPILASGTLMSALRLCAVVFPAFAALAVLGRRDEVDRAVVVVFTAAQAVLFLAWTRYYWVA